MTALLTSVFGKLGFYFLDKFMQKQSYNSDLWKSFYGFLDQVNRGASLNVQQYLDAHRKVLGLQERLKKGK